ncbi:hypothetical protein [Bradyrhizobium sp.]
MRRAQTFISSQIASGKMTERQAVPFLQSIPGMTPDVMMLMLKSANDFKQIEEAAKKIGTATDKSAEAGQKLTTSLSRLGDAITQKGRELMTAISDYTSIMIDTTTKDMSTEHTLGKGFHDTPWSAYWDALTFKNRGSGSGSRGDRNNNPGNIEDGPFARAHGATGSDGRFAVFPDYATGSAAQEALLAGAGYHGLTLHQFAQRYAEGSAAWEKTVGGELGIGSGDIVDNRDPRLAGAIRRAEGTGAKGAAASRGGITNSRTSTSSSEVNIGSITVNAPNATDADGVASGIGGALRRQTLIAPANTGLN